MIAAFALNSIQRLQSTPAWKRAAVAVTVVAIPAGVQLVSSFAGSSVVGVLLVMLNMLVVGVVTSITVGKRVSLKLKEVEPCGEPCGPSARRHHAPKRANKAVPDTPLYEGFLSDINPGYGFIRSLSFRKDVFFHSSEYSAEGTPVAGTPVSFRVSANPVKPDSFVATQILPKQMVLTPDADAESMPAFASLASKHKQGLQELYKKTQGTSRLHVVRIAQGPNGTRGFSRPRCA